MIRPLADRVLIEPDVEAQAPQAVGGLIVATSLAAAVTGEDARTSRHTGRVAAVGPDVNRSTGDPLSVGDRVVFGSDPGYALRLQGIDYVMLRAREVLGRIEEA